MNSVEIGAAMAQGFAGVFEQLAFMLTENYSCLEGPRESDGPWVQARIGFKAPYQGFMTVTATETFCRLLASNLLDVDENCEQARLAGLDAIKEVLNVASGRTLEKLAGRDVELDLEVPEIFNLPRASAAMSATGSQTVCLEVEGELVFIHADISGVEHVREAAI